MNEGNSQGGKEELSSEPTFRVRRADVIASIGFAGVLGLLGLFWSVTSQLSENLRVEIRNAENRITNRLQVDEQWIQECCRRK